MFKVKQIKLRLTYCIWLFMLCWFHFPSADVENAGEGDMEISITSSSGRNIPNKVESQGAKRFRVSYTPVESGLHRANVTFNNQHITGLPCTTKTFYCVSTSRKQDF